MLAIRRLFGRIMSKFSDDTRVLADRGYDIIDGVRLGEGTYAKVKCAYSREMKEYVAVKVIDKKKAPKDFLQKFMPRELVIIQTLSHPHIIEVYEIFEEGEKVYVIMEYAEKGDLLDHIKRRGCIRESKAKLILLQLLDAVDFCHKQGVIHRDLKCENVLINKNNEVKLTDFGFAKFNPNNELCKTFCGSAAYAAIEILQGVEYDGEMADVWSLGVVLFTMVTGRMPFDDANLSTLKKQIRQGVVFRKPKQNISDDCRDLIRRMLTTNRHQRITIQRIKTHRWFTNTGSSQSRSSSSRTVVSV